MSADVEGYRPAHGRRRGGDGAGHHRSIGAVIGASVAGATAGVVDAPGDNVLAEFASVVDAAQSAVEIQRRLQSRNAELPPSRQMRFRIGINLGDVIVEGERLYGDGVNIAARLESLAEGRYLASRARRFDQIEGSSRLDWEFIGKHAVKNIARPVRVHASVSRPPLTGRACR